jgi:endonuclease YncB( thermonuclease family)
MPFAVVPTRWEMAATFALGCVAGGMIVLTMQSRPAPASAAPPATDARPTVAAPARGGTHPADVLRVIDGDTFEARVHVWPGLDITTKVRLRGIDAPELKARCPAERAMAEAARDALRDLLAEGAVGVSAITPDKYGGRVVADAATHSIANVSAALQAKGLARSYGGGHRRGWCDEAAP